MQLLQVPGGRRKSANGASGAASGGASGGASLMEAHERDLRPSTAEEPQSPRGAPRDEEGESRWVEGRV